MVYDTLYNMLHDTFERFARALATLQQEKDNYVYVDWD